MRSEQEMMELLTEFARKDERIRLVTLEGSRTNPNIPRDSFQDYDISCFVTEMDSFKENDRWLDVFGRRLMMQKPEDMELFPPDLGNWFSYLMLFEDGNKVDLTLIPIGETEEYFAQSDGLVRVLLDKDGRVAKEPVANDRQYWIAQPTARQFDDCCNEFWMVSTYVVKGLARREILFAIDHLNEIARPNLLRMMAWRIGAERDIRSAWGKTISSSTATSRRKIGRRCSRPIPRAAIRRCGVLCSLVTSCSGNIREPWPTASDTHTRITTRPSRSTRRRFIAR
ncbi:hypothetical protein J19TS2_40670 [Cohnella xylanilytica]|nr:hypothetical protein J19TS2_40670 [Cohnella xylanilytica]